MLVRDLTNWVLSCRLQKEKIDRYYLFVCLLCACVRIVLFLLCMCIEFFLLLCICAHVKLLD
jgi:hypothetical protein